MLRTVIARSNNAPPQMMPPTEFDDEQQYVEFLRKLVDQAMSKNINLGEVNERPLGPSEIARYVTIWFKTSANDYESNPAQFPYYNLLNKAAKELLGDQEYLRWHKLGQLPNALMYKLGYTPDGFDPAEVPQANPMDDHHLLASVDPDAVTW